MYIMATFAATRTIAVNMFLSNFKPYISIISDFLSFFAICISPDTMLFWNYCDSREKHLIYLCSSLSVLDDDAKHLSSLDLDPARSNWTFGLLGGFWKETAPTPPSRFLLMPSCYDDVSEKTTKAQLKIIFIFILQINLKLKLFILFHGEI